nr:hypothetical protein [uncultured Roseateles sp.]
MHPTTVRTYALRTLSAALAALLVANAQAATALNGDGSWAGFNVDANLPPYSFAWVDDEAATLSFSVTVPTGFVGRLTVVDLGISGDQFRVMDGGAWLGDTGAAINGDVAGALQFSPEQALADSAFSRGVFTLAAGTHTISGLMIKSASFIDPASGNSLNTDASIGALNLTLSPVPEPSKSASLLAGLGMLVWALRRNSLRHG